MNYRYDNEDSGERRDLSEEGPSVTEQGSPPDTTYNEGRAAAPPEPEAPEEQPPVVFSAPFTPVASHYEHEADAWEHTPEEPEEPEEPEASSADWCEASYHEVPPRRENVFTPGLSQGPFYAPPRREPPRREESESPERRPRRRGGFVRSLCLVVACALISTAASVGVVNYGLQNGGFNVPQTQVTLGATPPPDVSPVADVVPGVGVLSGQEIYELATKQVVCVATEIESANPFYGTSSVYGSGFVISEDGYIITNYHVVESARQYGLNPTVILRDGTSYSAKLVGYEQNNDIAVLKIEAKGLSPVTLGSSANMQVGETIYAVGNPRRLDYTMTDGIISALDREVQVDATQNYTINMFQISAAVNSGNSGGPVYNDRGEVLGIVTAKYGSSGGSEGLGFAIPIDDAMSIASDLITKGYVSGRAQLGVTVETVDSSTAEYYETAVGAFVRTVTRGSCAETAGIRPGDIITKLGDTVITSSEELKLALRDCRAGDTTTIEVFRNDARITFEITLDEQIATS